MHRIPRWLRLAGEYFYGLFICAGSGGTQISCAIVSSSADAMGLEIGHDRVNPSSLWEGRRTSQLPSLRAKLARSEKMSFIFSTHDAIFSLRRNVHTTYSRGDHDMAVTISPSNNI